MKISNQKKKKKNSTSYHHKKTIIVEQRIYSIKRKITKIFIILAVSRRNVERVSASIPRRSVWTRQKRRSGGEPLATMCRLFDRPGNQTNNLPRRYRCLSSLLQPVSDFNKTQTVTKYTNSKTQLGNWLTPMAQI